MLRQEMFGREPGSLQLGQEFFAPEVKTTLKSMRPFSGSNGISKTCQGKLKPRTTVNSDSEFKTLPPFIAEGHYIL
jgi:hypothetical protein